MSSATSSPTVEHLLRELAPQVLAAVTRRFGDFGAAEDAVQEALLAAATHWPSAVLPDSPRAWLIQVAARRMTDHVRRESARRRREGVVVSLVTPELQLALAPDEGLSSEEDDTLALLFMCCHPSLSSLSAIALTLRAVGGLTTTEIARAFMVPEATMAQRISRAKQTIKSSGIPFSILSAAEQRARLGAVLHVIYLIFSEGYASSSGADLQRADLALEAIRLARFARALLPEDGEVAGLLALMLLTDARRPARSGAAGELIPLHEQDRSLWDPQAISEGIALLTEHLPRAPAGSYLLQAAIAAVHDEAPHADQTDWHQILALYELLLAASENPMVALNHAVAVAMVHGPAAGLALLEPLAADARLASHHRLDAVAAHLHEKAGDTERAIAHYLRAAERTANMPERDYLITQAARLREAR